MAQVDLPTATATELQEFLEAGALTSTELVKLCLAQISKHNKNGFKLNAIISTAPEAEVLQVADGLDAERKERGPRGPLHGIPVILKVQSGRPVSMVCSDFDRIICVRRP
jgi:amidase